MIVDYRCPKCDRPLVGKQDVVTLKRKPKREVTCPHCGSTVVRSEKVGDLGELSYEPLPGPSLEEFKAHNPQLPVLTEDQFQRLQGDEAWKVLDMETGLKLMRADYYAIVGTDMVKVTNGKRTSICYVN